MAQLLYGKPVAEALIDTLKPRIETCKAQGIVPTLAVVRVGNREDDISYERGIEKRCDALGLGLQKFVLDEQCTQNDLLEVINGINNNPSLHGCLLFRPLPSHLDEDAACAALDPKKDIDGITETSLFGVLSNQDMGFPPCTADACMQILKYYGYDLTGEKVTVLGRSLVVGKPLSMMLLAAHATVTICHTRTKDLPAVCRDADILVVATGHMNTIGAHEVRPGQVIIDVGINWDEQAQKLCGDVAFDEIEPIVDAITPVPGGVGSVTTAVLVSHVVAAAERRLG